MYISMVRNGEVWFVTPHEYLKQNTETKLQNLIKHVNKTIPFIKQSHLHSHIHSYIVIYKYINLHKHVTMFTLHTSING